PRDREVARAAEAGRVAVARVGAGLLRGGDRRPRRDGGVDPRVSGEPGAPRGVPPDARAPPPPPPPRPDPARGERGGALAVAARPVAESVDCSREAEQEHRARSDRAVAFEGCAAAEDGGEHEPGGRGAERDPGDEPGAARLELAEVARVDQL